MKLTDKRLREYAAYANVVASQRAMARQLLAARKALRQIRSGRWDRTYMQEIAEEALKQPQEPPR